jgi:hypothetical protein
VIKKGKEEFENYKDFEKTLNKKEENKQPVKK